MLNILVAEDNEGLRRLMSIHLRRAGYNVVEAADGLEALEQTDRVRIHLIITDVMMPRLDGYGLASELRSSGDNTPILMITVKDSLEDKRAGFHSGADDYLTKPIDFEEMLLRVEALLRRCNLQQEQQLVLGGTVLHSDTLLVTCGEITIDLRPKEFMLLQKLVSSPMRIFTRQMLMDDIWGYDSESDPRTVDTHIKRLREKLSDIPDFEIQTVRGLGYRAVLR